MINTKKIIAALFIASLVINVSVVGLILIHVVQGIDRSELSYLLTATMILFAILLLGIKKYSDWKYFYLRRRCIRSKNNKINIVANYLGARAVICTMLKEFHGQIISVDECWLKLKDRDNPKAYHLLKSSMMTSIKIKGETIWKA